MEFPLVSIIVPMYNTAGCIARCVKSICAQTYKSIEILLLNDGSTDDTLAVCRALAASDHRIALVDKTNTGAADTRNQGIALAVTEITYEPWHWRYVGPENAALIQQSGLCFEDAVAVLQKLAAGEKITG